jgi:hypothetical protein
MHPLTISKTIAIAVLAVGFWSAMAPAAVQSQPTQEAAENNDETNWDELLQLNISIEQPAGTISQFVENVRNTTPQLNIVVTESASAVRLPDIRLENVPVRGALSLIPTLTNSEVDVNFQSQIEGSEANIVLISGQYNADSSNVPTVRVFNVKRILTESTRDDLLTALDEGLDMMGEHLAPVEIKVHEATGLLFIKGTSPQLQLAESVVQEIENGLSAGVPFMSSDPLGGGLSPPTQNNSPGPSLVPSGNSNSER